jgi:hypothetical protein
MAAHSVRILEELRIKVEPERKRIQEFVNTYKHALDYAPGAGELDIDRWTQLHWYLDNLDKAIIGLEDAARHAYLVQTQTWEELGQPRNHEAWVDAMQ